MQEEVPKTKGAKPYCVSRKRRKKRERERERERGGFNCYFVSYSLFFSVAIGLCLIHR